MATLLGIVGDMEMLLDMCSDDVDPQVIQDTMEALEGEFEDKADGYANVMNELKAKADLLDAEIKRLKARKDSINNNITCIKNRLEYAMLQIDKPKFKTLAHTFYIGKNPKSLVMAEDINLEDVPKQYIIFPDPIIDKAQVKKALDNGEELTFAHYEQSESLKIR